MASERISKTNLEPNDAETIGAARIEAADTIIDNRRRRVGDFLRDRMEAGSNLSVVSAYFTIYAYESLRSVLDTVDRVRFLYGDPHGVGAMDPKGDEQRFFRLNDDGGIELSQVLTQKALARACADWIGSKVDVRTVRQAGFLHGKLYRIAGKNGDAALVGSSNLTRRGLGYGAIPNVELNLAVRDEADRRSLDRWFDELWSDESITADVKPQVLAALDRLGKAYAPEFVYYKTLFHVFEDWLARQREREGLLEDIHLHDTAIWQALYEYQKDGATSAINRLLKHNGCIVADSVGLGKTWTALAVVKFFELRNERVLVLCPKKLEANWTRYTSWAAQRNNPFDRDRFNYAVRAHTDLSRYDGRAGAVDLADFKWGTFDLVVIDESHNFRNEGRDRTDEAGKIVRRSRYNRLLEEVIKDGARTKLLMLSATPVNTSLRDLRNQIYLITEKRRDAFRETLRIGDIQALFGVAQREFQQWEKSGRSGGAADKEALIERLGADFLALLDAITIARSRDHLRRFYPAVTERIGGFPERAKPVNLHPPTDKGGGLSYDRLHDRIGEFSLAVYMPSEYVNDTTELDEEKARFRFDQRDRERWLIGMMRVNLLKRLESSVHAFALTTGRILERIDRLQQRIETWETRAGEADIETLPDEDEDDEEFVVGRGRRYRLDELDLGRWKQDLRDDRAIFADLHDRAERVTAERDAKLTELKHKLRAKVEAAPADKDGRVNRKVLVFTTFADTARYLYDELESWAHDELGVHIALITGGDGNRSTAGVTRFADILGCFAPKAQNWDDVKEEIDILIATDCLSEGQNLQDCDLVVNYDIHWNPVRLMQRFGRIDRLGSRNRRVGMVNFWPTADLDRYLDLKNRVEARMALADATATGSDDPLSEAAARGDLTFRDEQLKRLRDEILDIEDADDGVSMTDLTLDDFLADLLQYIQQNRAALEAAPFGIYAIAPPRPAGESPEGLKPDAIRPGAIFCLKHKAGDVERTPNRLWPYFLVYVRNDGTVRYTFRHARQCLALFRALAAGRPQASAALENAFDRETDHGRQMERYDDLLDAALRDIAGTFRKAQLSALTRDRGAVLAKRSERPDGAEDFELIAWLVVAEEGGAAGDGSSADA